MTWKKGDRLKKSLAAVIVIVALLYLAAFAKAQTSAVDRCCPTPYESGGSFCRNAFCRICTCDVKATDALKLLRWSVGHERTECDL